MKLVFSRYCLGVATLAMMLGATCQLNGQNQDFDWPQWRGPNRDDLSRESGLLQTWPAAGPKLNWLYQKAGDGYAGFSISKGKLFTSGAQGDDEFALCLDAETGKEIWRKKIDNRFTNRWGDGPRNTPTVSGDHVLFVSGQGNLSRRKVDDGSLVWELEFTELGGEVPTWGYAESPLVDNGHVIVTPGGSEGAIVALDEKSGKVKWQSRTFTDPAQYSSIIVADHPAKRHYVQLTMKTVVGIDPQNGDVIWKIEWPGRVAVIPTPIYKDQKVFVTSGYSAGSKLIDVSDLNNVKETWFSQAMKNHHGGVILLDDKLYGYSDRVGWLCQDFETGEKTWSEKSKLGKGAIGYADGRFYLLEESSGTVVLIEASPEGYSEKGRFVLSPQTENRKPAGRIWVHPVISNGKLYLRDQEIIYCFDIRA